MPINSRNKFYDPIVANKGYGEAASDDGFTAKEAGILGAGLGGPVAAMGGAYGVNRLLSQARTPGPMPIPPSLLNAPMDILGPGRRGPGGKILPFKQLGTLFTGPGKTGLPAGLMGAADDAAMLADDAAMLAGPKGARLPGFAPGSAVAQNPEAFGPRLFTAGADGVRLADQSADIAAAQRGLLAQARGIPAEMRAIGQIPGKAGKAASWLGTEIPAGATRRGALGKLAFSPAMLRAGGLYTAGQMGAPLAGSLGEKITGDEDVGDFLEGATKWGTAGAAAGTLTGPAAPIAAPVLGALGAIGGGAYEMLKGDKEDKAASEAQQAYDMQFNALLENNSRDMLDAVEIGLIDAKDMQDANKQFVELKDQGMDQAMAAETAYGAVRSVIDDPQAQLMAQLENLHNQEIEDLREAQGFAAQQMAPTNAMYAKMYEDLQGVRDMALADPNLDPMVAAQVRATAPAQDMANLALIQSAGNPYNALIQQNEQAYQSGLGDQLMQLYLANMQYAGGGADADSLSALLQQGTGGTQQGGTPTQIQDILAQLGG